MTSGSISQRIKNLLRKLKREYQPEKHFMRGPGPATASRDSEKK